MSRHLLGPNTCFLLLTVFLYPFSPSSIAGESEINVQDVTILNFTVMRKGEEIGTHVMKFSHSGDLINVEIKTDVEVKLLFIPVYHFYHESREVWQDGKLSKLVSHTDDDGEKHDLAVEGIASVLKIDGDGKQSTAPSSTIPASLWHPDLARLGPANILNTLDGHIMAVNVTFDGEENVTVQSGTVLAKHFEITGDLERELWYDPDGMLAKAKFKGSDGSDIEYVLK